MTWTPCAAASRVRDRYIATVCAWNAGAHFTDWSIPPWATATRNAFAAGSPSGWAFRHDPYAKRNAGTARNAAAGAAHARKDLRASRDPARRRATLASAR